MHLERVGLISFGNLAGYQKVRLPKTQVVFFYGKRFEIEFPQPENNTLQIGKVLLSQAGAELAPICGSAPCPGFQPLFPVG
jgi:hypothetical protein